MKTLRLTLLSLVAASAASAAFAGPGLQYWNARRADREAAKPAAKVEAAKCDHMVVKDGKRTTTVECTGATADTAKCKAACGM